MLSVRAGQNQETDMGKTIPSQQGHAFLLSMFLIGIGGVFASKKNSEKNPRSS
jgi:hypothetical protein